MKFSARIFRLAVFLIFVFSFSAEVLATEVPPTSCGEKTQCENRYRGFSFGLSYSDQISLNKAQRSSVDFFLLRFGPVIRLKSPRRAIFESFEFLPRGVLGRSRHPSGTVVGFEPMLRTNFLPIGKNTIFADLGAGINYLSADSKLPEITGGMQFSLRSDIGVKRSFGKGDRRAWFLSLGFLHYSNKGLKKPNQGINSPAISFGFIF